MTICAELGLLFCIYLSVQICMIMNKAGHQNPKNLNNYLMQHIRILRGPQMVVCTQWLPTPTSSTSFATPAFAPLTHTEKEALRAANGCYHCRKTPQSPGWVRHRSDNCPGDPARGIPPRTAPAVVAAVGPAGFSAVYEEGYAPVAAVFPTHYSDDKDDFSAGTDDSDLSTRDT
ncbi:hypothetical protein C8F04DRAFT_1182514 [Mycena alexandri]|uniref:Uncharacterized protein n=1 Tax=Mycena alexandri TaxID=1745969 RepID=A0AAD6SZW0_9AGAR|nr:hypothetical protein C8F04DRAFT_1182514 [Mycena alexandri]